MTTTQPQVLRDYERLIDEHIAMARHLTAPWDLSERAAQEKWVGDLRRQRAVLLEEWR